jgi:hypothetical protein
VCCAHIGEFGESGAQIVGIDGEALAGVARRDKDVLRLRASHGCLRHIAGGRQAILQGWSVVVLHLCELARQITECEDSELGKKLNNWQAGRLSKRVVQECGHRCATRATIKQRTALTRYHERTQEQTQR